MNINFYQHEYIFKTKSSDFFVQMLQEQGHIVTIINSHSAEEVNSESADLIILWHSDHLIASKRLTSIPLICIPMLDGSLDCTVSHYRRFSEVVYFCFSEVHHNFIALAGLRSFYLQYWPKMGKVNNQQNEKRIFFWERTPGQVNSKIVRELFRSNDFSITVRSHHDPCYLPVDNRFIRDSKRLSVSDNWYGHQEYLQLISEHGYFIAPREWEGIGLSFLEAMSVGCVVVARNNPTMSEYITNGINGYLYDSKYEIVLKNFEEIRTNSIERLKKGNMEFERDFNRIFVDAFFEAREKRYLPKKSFLPRHLRLRDFILWRKVKRNSLVILKALTDKL